jgi:chromosome partitioning protein
LDLIASNKKLWQINSDINKDAELIKKKIIDEVKDKYDFILFDCPPNMSELHDSLLRFCNEVFIPVSMDYLSLEGTVDVYNEVKRINAEKGNIKISTVIPTFVDRRNRRTDEIMDGLKKVFKDKLTNPIRICTKLAESPSFHLSIKEYDTNCNGSEDYEYLTDRVVEDNETYKNIAG